ncbi:hypothetical protein PR003_g26947 [Phytophthora rubi]|uniref:Crinkler effector protein N-terminal domain-containing protein n=2 Tax=Phytophthora rubi TaxID=129364 RepID=A0A6A4C448_9STRA|nr:hypothetical protein PR001_g25852 [Phytophthora rubi]KAE9284091.1 hypothetical protein PR003_g26947 [Phytophthora rubi]
MVELFCSIVGAPESAFPVNIDADQTVGDLKDAIWLDNKNNLKDVDAKKLQLFLVKTTTGAWLRDDDPAALKLNVGVIHPDIQTMTDVEQLEATWEIKDVLAVNNMTERFGCAPTSRQIHVLVVVPRKSELGWQSARLRPHIYDPGAKYFLLEKEVMDDSGLPPSRLMLYCRPMFHKQIEFMLKNVLEEGHLGWILGSPGTGKSATAMAFALTVDRRAWVVTWIHVDKYLGWRCVCLVGDERKTRVIDITELKQVLEFGDDTKHHLVLVDDWTAADSFTDLTVMCTEWFLQKDIVMKRRLAFICSVADRGKISDNLELMTRAMECKLWSWTLDEYLEATSNDDIFNNVFPYLDASGLSSADRSTIVQTKYYYAGGSCRY